MKNGAEKGCEHLVLQEVRVLQKPEKKGAPTLKEVADLCKPRVIDLDPVCASGVRGELP